MLAGLNLMKTGEGCVNITVVQYQSGELWCFVLQFQGYPADPRSLDGKF